MIPFTLRGESITLAQVVKGTGLADTGGQAKVLIRNGVVRVNGVVVTQPGKKLRQGDRIQSADGQEWILTA